MRFFRLLLSFALVGAAAPWLPERGAALGSCVGVAHAAPPAPPASTPPSGAASAAPTPPRPASAPRSGASASSGSSSFARPSAPERGTGGSSAAVDPGRERPAAPDNEAFQPRDSREPLEPRRGHDGREAREGRWQVRARGAHEAEWASVSMSTNPATGMVRARTNLVRALAAGLHYRQDGRWVESREEIELTPTGAVARQGQYQVAFAANANTRGAIDLTGPDGLRLRSHVVGLAYTDAAGASVFIAGVRDSVGSVRGNQVLYADALDGGFRADLRYTYNRGWFEQDVILREAPPAPDEFGLDPATARLEVWTEFLDAPAPAKTVRELKARPGKTGAVAGAGGRGARDRAHEGPDGGMRDETLDFGAMLMGAGVAFPAGREVEEPLEGDVPVGKEWIRVGTRTFLVEKVEISDMAGELSRLPEPGGNRQGGRDARAARPAMSRVAGLAATPRPPNFNPSHEVASDGMELASTWPEQPGYVVDYALSLTVPNQVFRSDTTYLVTGSCVLSGRTVIEGGAVVKYRGGATRLVVTGPLECRTSAYRPAHFVGWDDETVGERLEASTGDPGGRTYAARALEFQWPGGVYELRHLRFRNCQKAIVVGAGTTVRLRHGQIQRGGSGVQTLTSTAQVRLENVLLTDLTGAAAILSGSTRLRGEHLTLHRVNLLRSMAGGLPLGGVDLVNSLLVAVTNAPARVGDTGRQVFEEPSGAGVFASAGLGHHYLASVSPYRGAGDPEIDPELRAELAVTSTRPPAVLSGVLRQDRLLAPVTPRNLSSGMNPDVGYAYDAMDFLAQGLSVRGELGAPVTLVLTNGVVVGLDGSAGGTGILLEAHSDLASVGTPVAWNRLLPASCVQDGAHTLSTEYFTLLHGVGLGSHPTLRLRFTELSVPAGRMRHIANWGASFVRIAIEDSHVLGGELYLSPDSPVHVLGLTNTLFERVRFTFHPYARSEFHARNNLFKNGSFAIDANPTQPPGSPQWSLRDNLFDGVVLAQVAELPEGAASHNAYVHDAQNRTRLSPVVPAPDGAPTDVLLAASPAYERPVFGGVRRYYLPPAESFLTDHGSVLAADAGLYHHTTRSGPGREGGSRVDIGLHYVALDGPDGQPLDADGDLWPDYWEDRNGNGRWDPGERRWDADEPGSHLTGQPGLSVFTPLH